MFGGVRCVVMVSIKSSLTVVLQYAGHYIPALSYRVVQGNKNHDGPININLIV